MSERSFSSIVLGAHPREGRSRRLYRVGEVSEVCGDMATVRVDVDDGGQPVSLGGLQVLGPWQVQPGDWVELGYLDDNPNSAYVRSPLFSESRDPALGFKARVTVGDWDAVVDVNGGADYTSIQEALTAGHKAIYVRKGTYSLGATGLLISNANTELAGESRTETVLDLGGTTGYVHINADHCTLRNVKLTGGQNPTYGALRIAGMLAGVLHCLFDSNYRHFYGEPGWVSGCTLFMGNVTKNSAASVGQHGGHASMFVGNRVTDPSQRQLNLYAYSMCVTGNYFYSTPLALNQPGATVSGNVFHMARLLVDAGAYSTTINGNQFFMPLAAAIEIAAELCCVTGNAIHYPAGRGIYLTGSRNSVVGNTIQIAGASAIAASGNRNIVQGNQAHNSANYGVHVMPGATNNIVANNVAVGNASGQILDEGTGTVLDNNVTS
jgi:hypothetical protein